MIPELSYRIMSAGWRIHTRLTLEEHLALLLGVENHSWLGSNKEKGLDLRQSNSLRTKSLVLDPMGKSVRLNVMAFSVLLKSYMKLSLIQHYTS